MCIHGRNVRTGEQDDTPSRHEDNSLGSGIATPNTNGERNDEEEGVHPRGDLSYGDS